MFRVASSNKVVQGVPRFEGLVANWNNKILDFDFSMLTALYKLSNMAVVWSQMMQMMSKVEHCISVGKFFDLSPSLKLFQIYRIALQQQAGCKSHVFHPMLPDGREHGEANNADPAATLLEADRNYLSRLLTTTNKSEPYGYGNTCSSTTCFRDTVHMASFDNFKTTGKLARHSEVCKGLLTVDVSQTQRHCIMHNLLLSLTIRVLMQRIRSELAINNRQQYEQADKDHICGICTEHVPRDADHLMFTPRYGPECAEEDYGSHVDITPQCGYPRFACTV